MRRLLRLAPVLGLALATGAAASRVRVARERPYDVDVVPPAGTVRWLSLGHPLLASHLYWLSVVQYIGEPRGDERGWDRLFPLVELVTDLDPGHGYAYQVAGVVLATSDRVEQSNAILEKGTRNVPSRYILPYLRAFNAFYHEGDWALAGRWAEIAARAPGAPDHVKQNVLAYYVKADRADAAIEFLSHALEETQDPESRKAVEGQLKQALLERDAKLLDDAVKVYRARHGADPALLELLVAEGLVPELPKDPFGGAYVLGPDGRVRSSAHDFRFKPPASAAELYDPHLGVPKSQ
jgi:tetratricopeptide (TPR) repeat protein